jgi:glyoxylase-like metal-dependent hydrolase (beta-lactamase superfamily II)
MNSANVIGPASSIRLRRRVPRSSGTGPSWQDAAMDAPIRRVLAPNPGPMTLEGTNTWIVGAEPTVVIDPGPDDPAHLDAVRAEAGRVGVILLTHRHPDHVVFFAPDARALFTGDAVLGRGTSVIDPPEGDLAAYLRSLDAMIALHPRTLYPGHGPAVWAAVEKLQEYRDHREQRERQVLEALEDGPRTPEEIVAAVYVDYPPELTSLASRSILAHLLKLEREGRAAHVGAPRDNRFEAATPAACRRCGRPAMPRSSLCRRCSTELLQEAPSRGENATGST